MLDFGGFIILIEFVFFIFAIPAAYLILRKISEQVKVSDTVVINYDGSRTNGRVIGNLISKRIGKKGRLHIKYLARDSEKGEVVEVIVEPNKVVTYPKGIRSAEKAILEILPEDAQTYISNFLSKIESLNADTNIISAKNVGLDRQQMHLDDMGEGEISSVNLGLIKDFESKLLKSKIKEDGRTSPRTYPTGRENFTA